MTYSKFTTKQIKNEIWKPIPNYENRYHVSNLGRVKSLLGLQPRILKSQMIYKGYLRTALLKNGKQRRFLNHRLVVMAFLPEFNKNLQVNHKNGIKTDNRLENLESCTNQENSIHAVDSGLRISLKGEENKNSKLTVSDVIKIKKAIQKNNQSLVDIGKQYNVQGSAISAIKHGRTWRHVQI